MTHHDRTNIPSPDLGDERLYEAPHDAAVSSAPPVAPSSGAHLRRIAMVTGAVLLALFVVTLLPRLSTRRELLADAASRDSAPSVQVATVQRAAAGSVVTLPGTLQPLHESAIYARVGGYVRRWYADIGQLVKQGAVLADIDAPELEQNVQQARAQASMTHAALELARADLARWNSLAKDSAVTGQELDQKRAAFASAQANTSAAEANLRRLVQTREYTRVVAPFTGVITARNVDIGALITVAGATSAPVGSGGSAAGGRQPVPRRADGHRAHLRDGAGDVRDVDPSWARSGRAGPGDSRAEVRRPPVRARRPRSTRRRGRCWRRSTSRTATSRSCRGCTRR